MSAASLENPHAGQGMVLLDIGGDVGALVVTMPASMDGIEVEIRPEGAHGHGHVHGPEHVHYPHVAVVSRPVAGGRVPSLVFPDLVEGRYELFVKETSEPRLAVAVSGGVVTTADWPR